MRSKLLDAESVEERIARKTIKSGPNDCWLWRGPFIRSGYGTMTHRGVRRYAHRWTYEVATGTRLDDPKVLVCHRCDNPPCVNPAHLFLGTYLDNNRDSQRKGRGKIPRLAHEQHPMAKLTRADVREIRSLYTTGRKTVKAITRGHNKIEDIGRKFGVSASHVCRIGKGELWPNA